MAQTSLSPGEAQAKINQIDQAMSDALQLKNNMQDITVQMTSSSWLGNQSTKFGQKMQQYDDDFNGIINRLTQVAETGKHNMTTFINQESA
jgi:uncharacterized protein YukE